VDKDIQRQPDGAIIVVHHGLHRTYKWMIEADAVRILENRGELADMIRAAKTHLLAAELADAQRWGT
jgi:hypothetical protein